MFNLISGRDSVVFHSMVHSLPSIWSKQAFGIYTKIARFSSCDSCIGKKGKQSAIIINEEKLSSSGPIILSLSHSLSVVLSQSSDSIQWKRPWQAAETKTDKYKCSRCPSECLGQRSIAVQRRLWVQAEQKKGTACKKKKRCESRVWSCSGQTIRDSQCDRYKLTFERRVMFSPKWTIWTLKCVVHISIYHLSNKNDDHQTNKGGQCNFTMQPYSDRVD